MRICYIMRRNMWIGYRLFGGHFGSKRTVLSSVQCKMNSNTQGEYSIHANSTGQISSNHLEHSFHPRECKSK